MCIPTWKPPSLTSTLSIDQQSRQHTSTHTFQQNSERNLAFVRHWLDNLRSDYEPHTMAPRPPSPFTPTPQSKSTHTPRRTYTRERRSSRQSTHTSDTQTSKTTTVQTYRLVNLRASGVYIDQSVALPSGSDEYVRQILGIAFWEDQVPAPNELGMQLLFSELVDEFATESQRLASKCALEADWQICLFNVVKKMTQRLGGVLETNVSEKVWNSHLKPKRLVRQQEPPQANTPNIDPSLAMETDADGSEVTPASPHSLSTMSTEIASMYHITTPKPDMTVGLAHQAFTERHQNLLYDYHACKLILSDPHAAQIGLRFPFMIVELKANVTLTAAQNQAAVGGACILKIQEDLARQAARSPKFRPEQVSPLPTLAELSPALALCFSIVTEGPTHELWVHFKLNDNFHMLNLKSWRTTIGGHAKEFINCLGRIIEWGKGDFKEHVVEMLDQVPSI
ncbi:hypothetical protein J3E72DRAFT_204473 [Bipolaris maydis]|nr:hypothetical protein J3E74DRAFT_229820 [Bipolaris maydis]KAJ6192353.1 hypothetical protein J3E72DRAFT_204473 [Bipolaris maydis]KAJ6203840.1 hypothetical protein PSV09DRAFT_2205191 [Bipolaris maydis]